MSVYSIDQTNSPNSFSLHILKTGVEKLERILKKGCNDLRKRREMLYSKMLKSSICLVYEKEY